MDRQIIYPGAIPLETDLLNTNKYTMMALGKLASTMMGTNTYLRGLTCAPSSPASMVVTVDRGEIYSVQNVDNTAYSSIAADTVNTILKQGIILGVTSFTLTAPTTAGQSVNYLVQVTYSDTDSGATVLPYYNAANPSVAYSGPNGSGAAQNTVRSGVCTVALKQGVAATTGTQTTPSADTGYTGAWVITVAQGATTVTSANISLAANAPFLPVSGLVDAVQKCTMTYAADTGSANTYVASYVPKLPTLIDGMRLTFKAKTANTGASTFAPNGNTAYPLYSHANQALQGGEIIANGLIEVEWNSTLTAWVLCGNSGGALPVAAATQSNHAMQLGQAVGRLLNVQYFTASGTYTPTAGTTSVVVELLAGGGAGGGVTTTTGGAAAPGGGGGGYGRKRITSGFSGVTVTIGAGGTGAAFAAGGNGGGSSFGALMTSTGGSGGGVGSVTTTNVVPMGVAGAGGTTTLADVSVFGGSGQVGLAGPTFSQSGQGGGSEFAPPTFGPSSVSGSGYITNGVSAIANRGAGGSGAVGLNNSIQASGGAGGSGLCIVWEYA